MAALFQLKKPLEKFKALGDIRGRSSSRSSAEPRSPQSPASFKTQDSTASEANSDKHHLHRASEDLKSEKIRRSEDKARKRSESKARQNEMRRKEEKFLEEGPEELTSLFKPLSMNMSKRREYAERFQLKDLDIKTMNGQVVTFRARVHTIRRMSAKFVFLVLRQQTFTVQGVLQSHESKAITSGADSPKGKVSEYMVRSVEHYYDETIVLVTGKIRPPPQEIKNATIHDAEIEIMEIHKLSDVSEHVPFSVYDAENINRGKKDVEDVTRDESDLEKQNQSPELLPQDKATESLDSVQTTKSTKQDRQLPQRIRLTSRIVDLRTGCSQSIFRIQSGICNAFRSYLDTQGFLEIHTPKLQGGATESGATVFEVNYFGRPAFLAQSPQLAKQMCIAADFERVYEIGPVFRAENSNTPRHLAEYTGLDIEMALEEHYHEALDMIDGMFKNLWKTLYERFSHEISVINEYYPHEKLVWLEETPRIPFSEGIKMLKEAGWTDEDGNPPSDFEDLATRAEIRLGELVKEKYGTDYYILDKFPASARPFYTMPDPQNSNFTNSFDIFLRGQEITTGGQRIHDSNFLEKRMKKLRVAPESMQEYLDGFRWGAPPHAGAGIGLERLLFLFLNLGNIRLASLFPRDPKSLPLQPPVARLRHPEASTTNPPWEDDSIEETDPIKHELQPLEKLIANYGDAANTSWLDERYQVWRDPETGAAQGYVVQNGFAITVGEPLCAKSQYARTVANYLSYLKTQQKGLKPLWLIVGPDVEAILGEKYGWTTLACAAEERVNPKVNPAQKDSDLARKFRHADKEGIKMVDLSPDEPVPEDIRAKIDLRIKDWQNARKGKQVHLTEIRPWIDQEHRRFFYAVDKAGEIHALVVLHQLSYENGYQVKFGLEFPNAPSGTIESLTVHALNTIAASEPDTKSATFGTGASKTVIPGRNVGKHRIKALAKTYESINKRLKLTNKSNFREKLGAQEDMVYICYPHHGLGPSGIKAILGFLDDQE